MVGRRGGGGAGWEEEEEWCRHELITNRLCFSLSVPFIHHLRLSQLCPFRITISLCFVFTDNHCLSFHLSLCLFLLSVNASVPLHSSPYWLLSVSLIVVFIRLFCFAFVLSFTSICLSVSLLYIFPSQALSLVQAFLTIQLFI